MKKIFTVFVLGAALSLGAAAQNWQDALMFTENNYSGTARGVAMGNAKPEVKKVADYVTATNDEDGIVEVIQKFIL